MAVQPGLCRTWSETLKTGFLTTAGAKEDLQDIAHRKPKYAKHSAQRGPQRQTASGDSGPSLEQELARRKVDTDASEFWFYMRSELQRLRRVAGNGSSLAVEIDTLLRTGRDYQR